jgi:hypothetical protein
MYGGVVARGSPGGSKLHDILSKELPESVGNSPLLITEAIIDKDGLIRAHGKNPGIVNGLPGGNVKGTYETIDVLVIDDSKVSPEDIVKIRDGELSAKGKVISPDMKLGGARMSEAKAKSLKERLGVRPLVVGNKGRLFSRGGRKPEKPERNKHSSDPPSARTFGRDLIIKSGSQQSEVEAEIDDQKQWAFDVVRRLALGGPFGAVIGVLGDPERLTRAGATITVSPHMFGARGGIPSIAAECMNPANCMRTDWRHYALDAINTGRQIQGKKPITWGQLRSGDIR